MEILQGFSYPFHFSQLPWRPESELVRNGESEIGMAGKAKK
jgi:hypothetical protein